MSSSTQKYTRQYLIVPNKLGMNGTDITAEATSNSIGIEGYNQLTLSLNLDWIAATVVVVKVDISLDGGASPTWATLQTLTAAGGGAFTAADDVRNRAVSADDIWALNYAVNGKLARVRITGTGATDDVIYVSALLGAV